MAGRDPVAELDARYSSEGATPTTWDEARERFVAADIYWLSTVRPDGRPHVTPLLSVWLDGAAYFCTGPHERKAMNLARNAHCILMTGCNALDEALDVVVEGDAVKVSDDARLRRLAAAYEAKYGSDWRFTVRDGAFVQASAGDSSEAMNGRAEVYAEVYEVVPARAFGFRRGEGYSQTRWRLSG